MAKRVANLAWMTTATAGTGTMTLGSAVTSYFAFVDAGVVNADTVTYEIIDGNNRELGVGTYTTAGTTLSRDTVTASLIAGVAGTTKLTLSGTATVFIAAMASDFAGAVSGSGVDLTPGSRILPIAGTTTLAPIKMQSGTNLTTAEAGAFEYDGKVFYGSHVASARGVVDVEQFIRLTSNYTLVSQTLAQKIFNSTTNGALTVNASTVYKFKCAFALAGMSATSGTFGFALGGTATLTSQAWQSVAAMPTALANSSSSTAMTYNTAANTGLTPNSTNGIGHAIIEGFVSVNAAGTLIPRVSLTQAAAAIVQAGSWCSFTPLGTDTVTNVGNWS